MAERASKRVKTDDDLPDAARIRLQRSAFLSSLSRSVSPPLGRSNSPRSTNSSKPDVKADLTTDANLTTNEDIAATKKPNSRSNSVEILADRPETSDEIGNGLQTGKTIRPHAAATPKARLVASPFQLIRIRDLPENANRDTVTVKDILCNPLIREAWIFDFLFDIPWLLQQFDPDTVDMTKIHIVHGSWKEEDSNRQHIAECLKQLSNLKEVKAHLPDPFGTHHTKMMILFRHDDLAQIVIHTANMIAKDWTNMTQAVWQSSLLPLKHESAEAGYRTDLTALGTGLRFKHDFVNYLKAYGKKLEPLIDEIAKYDFCSIRAALIGSVPSKLRTSTTQPSNPLWGWPGLRRALQQISPNHRPSPPPHIIAQVSSIATLPEKWIRDSLFATLSTQSLLHPQSPSSSPSKTSKLSSKTNDNKANATFSIIYPDAPTIRSCRDGYSAGSSIHLRRQSAAQKKQVEILRPYLCHWSPPSASASASASEPIDVDIDADAPSTQAEAHRHLAAPHIKTYISFASRPTTQNPSPNINWALLTSANLSQQAWGGSVDKDGNVSVKSFELGVLVWPQLFRDEDEEEVRMVPVFGRDVPDAEVDLKYGEHYSLVEREKEIKQVLVGLRMPYDLPLMKYSAGDQPWSPHDDYTSLGPDRHGLVWTG